MSIENIFDSVVNLIKDSNIESVVRWFAGIHNMIAPGYLYLYMFEYKNFNELSSFKLLVLAFILSVPLAYFFYVIAGNILRKTANKEASNQAVLRIQALLWVTILVVILDVVIFIAGIFNA